jgi:hypothetical protein
VIREFTPDEDAIVTQLQQECAVGAWLIPIGFRAGIKAGVRRALAAAEAAPYREQVAAIKSILDDA